jgi:hypothetical protein
MVDEVGFEPTSPEGGRFTVCGANQLLNSSIYVYYINWSLVGESNPSYQDENLVS